MTSVSTMAVRPDGREPAPLADLLRLDAHGPQRFCSRPGVRAPGRLYGGEVAAQAVVAAGATVPAGRRLHSLHAHYLSAGSTQAPVAYDVCSDRDGRSFSSRTVSARQHDAIFTLSASFQEEQDGVAHQLHADRPLVDLPGPEDCAGGDPDRTAWAAGVMSRLPVELRFIDDRPGLDAELGVSPRIRAYMRARGRLAGDHHVQAAGLVYLSDLLMISAALLPHEIGIHDPRVFTATITHSVWVHAPVRADAWMLYDVEGSWAGGGRTLSAGRLYDLDGFVVASTAQEGLVRYRTTRGVGA